MFYKLVTICSLAIVALQLLAVLEWTCLDLRQEIAMLQNAIEIQRIAMKSCSPEALEAAVDENARLRQGLGDLQGALKAAEFGSLKGGAPPLSGVTEIIQSQEGEWGIPLFHQLIEQHPDIMQRVQTLFALSSTQSSYSEKCHSSTSQP